MENTTLPVLLGFPFFPFLCRWVLISEISWAGGAPECAGLHLHLCQRTQLGHVRCYQQSLEHHAGKYRHRRSITPHSWSSQTVCEIITCSCFHRAAPFHRHVIRFDSRYRALADLVFTATSSPPTVFLRSAELVTGTFTVTGDNLAWSETFRKGRKFSWELSRGSFLAAIPLPTFG